MLIRGHHELDEQFTQVPNSWLRDPNLSLGARGLLAQLLSHKPGWTISLQSLASANNCGLDRVRNHVNELTEAGYLARSAKQRRNSKGFLAGYDYTLGHPSLGFPTKDKPTKGNPTKGNPTHKNTIEKNTIEKKTIEELFLEFWKAYPRKADKGPARKAFEKALDRASFDTILAGAQAYREDPNREDRFTKYPATWLNADAWENPPLPSKKDGKKAQTQSLIEEWRTK